MLLKHVGYYVLARGLPGFVNFAALAVYTRLLVPDEFGRYALVLSGVGLANVVLFQWLRLVLLRFLQANGHNPQRFLAGVLTQFITLALAVTGLGVLLALMWPDPVWRHLLALAVILLIVQAWFELNLELVRSRLAPLAYGKLLGSKALIALATGALLAWLGLGVISPIWGLIAGHAVAFALFGMGAWNGIRPAWSAAAELREQLRYGLPLTVTFALTWVVSSSDRIMLAWLLGDSEVGEYAAGYDLAFQAITLLLVTVNTAAHPLAIHALENHGHGAATDQLRQNGELIMVAALTSAVVLVTLGPALIPLIIGDAYRDGALSILPLVAIAAAVAGIKAYHFDMAFHLGRQSKFLVITGGLAAASNIVLNLILIPAYGISGASAATLAAYAFAAAASAWIGIRVFPMPNPFRIFAKAFVIAGAAALATNLLLPVESGFVTQLVVGVITAIAVVVPLAIFLNVANARARVLIRL